MRFSTPLVPGRLIRRYQRFLADVRLDDGSLVTAHCPNPGSMKGCMREEGRVLLSESDNPARKLAYTWELARIGRHWVCVNTMRPNQVVGEALARGGFPEFSGYPEVRAEAPMGENRRVDFLLGDGDRRFFVEVKSVTLAVGRRALFPDSVTKRGSAHLGELAAQVRAGHRAAMLYLVGRGDCDEAGPAVEIDPAYASHLGAAAAAGVETIAYRAKVLRSGITVGERIPFHVRW